MHMHTLTNMHTPACMYTFRLLEKQIGRAVLLQSGFIC
uniref:Uncharacterized protein n=1 Tax=Anguilla anguilla TaxID=7936 RepID=A0A0E9S1V0_ANGAN